MSPSNKEAPETIKITYLIMNTIRILTLLNLQEAIEHINSIAEIMQKRMKKCPKKSEKKHNF